MLTKHKARGFELHLMYFTSLSLYLFLPLFLLPSIEYTVTYLVAG